MKVRALWSWAARRLRRDAAVPDAVPPAGVGRAPVPPVAEVPARPLAPAPVPEAATVDRGSFSHGFCMFCGWQGPGRRARNLAAADVRLHGLTGCGEAAVAHAGTTDERGGRRRHRDSGVPDRERLSAHGRS